MKIEVTTDDIMLGARCNTELCPIALAIKRASGLDAEVLGSWARVGGADFNLPYKAMRFIGDFDERKPVQSFAFDLPITEVAL